MYKDIKGDVFVKVVAENPEDIEKRFKPVVKKEETTEEVKKDEKVEKKSE